MRVSSIMAASFAILAVACSKSPPKTAPASPDPTVKPDGEGKARPQMSASACEADGGKVVGDIGDGAIHKPNYVCESGKPPVGSIAPDAGGPVAVEGAVCCK